MTERKLQLFPNHCRHYNPRPGGNYHCLAGVDIRAHVGGPDYGWLSRAPCVATKLSRDVVSCEKHELPTAEEVGRDTAAMNRIADILLGGTVCPECGRDLDIRENDEVKVKACPGGCVSTRECKRIGEHP